MMDDDKTRGTEASKPADRAETTTESPGDTGNAQRDTAGDQVSPTPTTSAAPATPATPLLRHAHAIEVQDFTVSSPPSPPTETAGQTYARFTARPTRIFRHRGSSRPAATSDVLHSPTPQAVHASEGSRDSHGTRGPGLSRASRGSLDPRLSSAMQLPHDAQVSRGAGNHRGFGANDDSGHLRPLGMFGAPIPSGTYVFRGIDDILRPHSSRGHHGATGSRGAARSGSGDLHGFDVASGLLPRRGAQVGRATPRRGAQTGRMHTRGQRAGGMQGRSDEKSDASEEDSKDDTKSKKEKGDGKKREADDSDSSRPSKVSKQSHQSDCRHCGIKYDPEKNEPCPQNPVRSK